MPKQKNVIFDMIGVLFLLNMERVVWRLGFLNLLRHILIHRRTPGKSYLRLLDTIARKEKNLVRATQYKQYQLPACIGDLMVGKAIVADISGIIQDMIEQLDQEDFFRSNADKKMMKRMTQLVYSPAFIAKYAHLNKPLYKLIKELRQNISGKIYLLTNIDLQSLAILRREHAPVFSLFDGIVASCLVGLKKPNEAIYQYLISEHHLDPASCIFIDDQEENLLTAKKVGMQTIKYKKFSQAKRQLNTFLTT